MTPELADAVQEMMNKHYMGWLDESLPALGGIALPLGVDTAASEAPLSNVA